MSLSLLIHRGARQIGGSCIEVSTLDTRMLLDAGLPLEGSAGSPAAQDLDSRVLQAPLDAVFISHAHQDHAGLLPQLPEGVPVYASAGTWALLRVMEMFGMCGTLPERQELLVPGKEVRIGGLSVCPYLVDHSAPDALALVIQGEGRTIIYTGDLRAHGRKSTLFPRLMLDLPMRPDVLLMDGTMVGHGQATRSCATEQDVENKLMELLKGHPGHCLVFASGQNLDRTVSAFRAAKRCGRELVIDLYTAYVQHVLQHLSPRLPQHHWDGVHVKYYHHHREVLFQHDPEFLKQVRPAWIKLEDMETQRGRFLILARHNRLLPKVLDKLFCHGEAGDCLVWSQWDGYLDSKSLLSMESVARNLPMHHVHCGGHATVADLIQLVQVLDPVRVVPVHTSHPEAYAQYFTQVVLLEDGTALSL